MKKVSYQLETLSCPTCLLKIEGVLKKTKGVVDFQVLFNSSKVKAKLDESVVSSQQVKQNIEKLGYKVLSEQSDE
ncbi:MAG: heavy-metal-associated domain-containing protein [Sphaerochaetaceae bacterium]|jgi:copper chaperone CopZ